MTPTQCHFVLLLDLFFSMFAIKFSGKCENHFGIFHHKTLERKKNHKQTRIQTQQMGFTRWCNQSRSTFQSYLSIKSPMLGQLYTFRYTNTHTPKYALNSVTVWKIPTMTREQMTKRKTIFQLINFGSNWKWRKSWRRERWRKSWRWWEWKQSGWQILSSKDIVKKSESFS